MSGLLVFSAAVLLPFLSYSSADVKLSHVSDIAAVGQTSRVTCTVTTETFDGWYGPKGVKISTDSSQRVHVELKSATKYRLVISNPEGGDGGHYQCKGSKNSAIYNLNILIVTAALSQTLQLGKTGVIAVNAQGYPKVKYVWTKGQQEIEVKGRYNVRDDGSLVINKVVKSDQANYTIVSSILDERKDQTLTIDVKVFESAKITETPKTNRYPTTGRNITFKCKATGYPPPKYTWKNPADTPMSTFGRFHVEDGTLTIMGVQLSDKGIYTCEASSGDGSIAKAKAKIIDVIAAPVVTTSPDGETELNKGVKQTLTCTATGTPPVTVVWKLGREAYPRQETSPGESVITFDAIRSSDTGKYVCEATNAAQDADGAQVVVKKYVQLNVRAKPELNYKASPGVVHSFLGNKRSTYIRCAFFGYPRPEVIIYDKQKKKVGNGTGEAVLILITDKVEMFQAYRCNAKNLYGKANYTVELKFAERPSEPRNVRSNASCNTITLFWDAPAKDGGMPVDHYVVEFGKDGGDVAQNVVVQNVDARETRYVARKLQPKTSYTLDVSAHNLARKGLAVTSNVDTTEFCRPSRPAILEPQSGILEHTAFTLKWRAPEEDGGDPDISYRVRYTPYLSDGDLGDTEELKTSELKIEIVGLKLGTQYKVEVVAVNKGGESEPAVKIYEVLSVGARSWSCATSASLLLLAVTAGVSFVVNMFSV